MVTQKQIKRVLATGNEIRQSKSLPNHTSDYVRLVISRDYTNDGKETILVIEVEEPTGKDIFKKRLLVERNSNTELMTQVRIAEKRFKETYTKWKSR